MKAVPDYAKLPVGAAVTHPAYGRGKIVQVHDDGRRNVAFGGHTGSVSNVVRTFSANASTSDSSNSDEPFPTEMVGASYDREAEVLSTNGEPDAQPQSQTQATPFDGMLSKALSLTVVWNRPQLARKILVELEGAGSMDEVGARDEVAVALQRALELQCAAYLRSPSPKQRLELWLRSVCLMRPCGERQNG